MKKILDFIFEPVNEEDEEEVIVNAPIVKHTFEEKKTVASRKMNVSETKQEEVQKKNEEVKRNDILNKKPSFGIEADGAKVKKIKQKNIEVKTFKPEKKFEFQPPMSPIFGVIDSHKEESNLNENNIHGTVVSAQNNKSHIGTVFSPIYGTIVVEGKKDDEIHQETLELDLNDEIVENSVKENIEVDENDEIAMSDGYEEISLIDEEDNINEEFIEIEINDGSKAFDEYFSSGEIKDEDIMNSSIDDILVKPDDETYIFSDEISLFDDELDD